MTLPSHLKEREPTAPRGVLARYVWLRALCVVALLSSFSSPAAAETRLLRIGYQKSSSLLLAKLDGELERQLLARGVKVEWREFTSGPPLLQAIGSAVLDIGEVGDAPGVFAQAAGAPLRYVAYANASPASIGLIVKADSAIRSLAELRGKRVGVAEGSSAHYFLLQALGSVGLKYTDITPVLLQPPDARTAFEARHIDAWAIWDPFLAAAEVGKTSRVLTNGAGLVPFYGFYLASQKFLAEAPELVAVFSQQLEALGPRAKLDVEKTANTLATQLGIPLEVARLAEGRKLRYGAKPLSPEVIQSQQKIADVFLSQGLIKKPIVVQDYVWTQPR
jgi:sulfonate transport system substrate-binding protein